MAVEVLTIPSNWAGPKSINPLWPYRRIVGIALGDETAWSKTNPTESKSGYDRDAAQSELLGLPDPFDQRLIAFFDRYFSENRRLPVPELLFDHEFPDLYADAYNCHRFAKWMIGDPAAYELKIPGAPDKISNAGERIRRNLRMGEHGVISRIYGNAGGSAYHSVIGLGEQTDECLQVSGTGGTLGISTIGNVLNDYIIDPIDRDLALFVAAS